MTDDSKKTTNCSDDYSKKPCYSRVRILDTRELFEQSNEVRVRHCNEEYRLMLTRNNKLILIK